MACENLKRIRDKILMELTSVIDDKNVGKDVKQGLRERLHQVDRDISACMKKDRKRFSDKYKAREKRDIKDVKKFKLNPKKTGGFRDEWLEPPCCPEI